MHVLIFYIMRIGLLVVVGAKTSEALITQVRFYGIHTTNQHIHTAVKLLLI